MTAGQEDAEMYITMVANEVRILPLLRREIIS